MITRIIKDIARRVFYYGTFNPILKKTNWYKNFFIEDIYPGNLWYRDHDERNFDLIVLGSSSAKWAFDFENCGIKAMNWAQQPQTLVQDYNLLRNFHSILRKHGTVIITIMPFTSLNKQTGLMDAMKYLKVHSHEPIETYMLAKAKRYANVPILFGRSAVKALFKYILGKDTPRRSDSHAMVEQNPMTEVQLEANALMFVNGWKKQFGISDFNAPLTEENRKAQEFRTKLMRTIIDFCTERSYRPVFVIPPVTKHLAKYYTTEFEETYIYSFLRNLDRKVLTLDYSKEEELQKDTFYFNSFFMNKSGRKLFTQRVLTDLNVV